MNPHWFPQLLSWLYMRPGPYQRIVELMGLAFLTVTRHPLRRNMDNVLLAMKAMLYADKLQVYSCKLPRLSRANATAARHARVLRLG